MKHVNFSELGSKAKEGKNIIILATVAEEKSETPRNSQVPV